MEKSRERSNAPQHRGVIAIEKRAFWSPSTTTFFTYIYIYIYIYCETSTYENPIMRKVHNTKRVSKNFPSYLTKKYSRYENKNDNSRPTAILPEFISLHHMIALLYSYLFFNIYENDYVVINEYIRVGIIFTLYTTAFGGWSELRHLLGKS